MGPCSPVLYISANSKDESSEGTAVPRTPVVSLGNEFIPLSWNAEVSQERKRAFPCPLNLPFPCER